MSIYSIVRLLLYKTVKLSTIYVPCVLENKIPTQKQWSFCENSNLLLEIVSHRNI